MLVIDSVHQWVSSTTSMLCVVAKIKVLKIVKSFGNRLVFHYYIEMGAFLLLSFFCWHFFRVLETLLLLRLVLIVVSVESVEKILWLRRPHCEFEMMSSVKALTVYSLFGYVRALYLYNRWYCSIVEWQTRSLTDRPLRSKDLFQHGNSWLLTTV